MDVEFFVLQVLEYLKVNFQHFIMQNLAVCNHLHAVHEISNSFVSQDGEVIDVMQEEDARIIEYLELLNEEMQHIVAQLTMLQNPVSQL